MEIKKSLLEKFNYERETLTIEELKKIARYYQLLSAWRKDLLVIE